MMTAPEWLSGSDLQLVASETGDEGSEANPRSSSTRHSGPSTVTVPVRRLRVERFFGYVTADLLQRSDHRSVQALEADVRTWVKAWNEDPKVFVWTKTAEQILGSIGRLMQRISNPGA